MFFLPSSVNLYSTTYVGISTPFRTELLAPILDYTSLAVTTTYLLRLEGRRTGGGPGGPVGRGRRRAGGRPAALHRVVAEDDSAIIEPHRVHATVGIRQIG